MICFSQQEHGELPIRRMDEKVEEEASQAGKGQETASVLVLQPASASPAGTQRSWQVSREIFPWASPANWGTGAAWQLDDVFEAPVIQWCRTFPSIVADLVLTGVLLRREMWSFCLLSLCYGVSRVLELQPSAFLRAGVSSRSLKRWMVGCTLASVPCSPSRTLTLSRLVAG